MKTDDPPNIIMCIIACAIMLLLPPTLQDDKPQQLSLSIDRNALIAQSSPININIKRYTLRSLWEMPVIHKLAVCETGLNNNAINWNDVHRWKDGTISRGSFGLLQYGKPTFQEFCVDKYGLENDIWDPEIQIECASRMIDDGYLCRWGCAKLIVP